MLKRYLVLPVLLVVPALAFAACGSSGSSDEAQITEAIQHAMTGRSPADCKKFQTQAFVEQDNQTEGKEAVKVCEEDVAEVKDNPKSVAVSKVEVDGSDATADVAFTGGGFTGQTVGIALVKDGGQWKVDKAKRFVKLDKARLVEQFEAVLAEPSTKVKKSTASCFVKALEKDSQDEIEELVLSGSNEPTAQLLESCS